MDAIECGIVKLPRVPVADNIPGADVPKFRELWKHVGPKMQKKGRAKAGELDPRSIPVELQTALEALYGRYEKTFELWRSKKIPVPPCFIVVCQNTSHSELIYDYISGFEEKSPGAWINGKFPLFDNLDEYGNPLPRPRTLLIDSEQLESGEALDDKFPAMAGPEIEAFRREIVQRTGDQNAADKLSDQDLLPRGDEHRRQARPAGRANPVRGLRLDAHRRLGREPRDARSWRPGVRHAIAMRAGDWPRASPPIVRTERSRTVQRRVRRRAGRAVRFHGQAHDRAAATASRCDPGAGDEPERDHLEIRFPRVTGYRVELPPERLEAHFTDDHRFELTPAVVGQSVTNNAGIIGESVDLTLVHTGDMRPSQLVFHLTVRLISTKWRDEDGAPKTSLFGQMKPLVKRWIDGYLECKGGTFPAN
ncbi:MAG: hypothetical protein SFV18_15465 [Bryobacteraceae bacterium]|nr:hypothetical protein [Bryobacteraceae bacterium]